MSQEYFWSLSLEVGHVQSAVWTIEGDKAKILTIGPSIAWEDINEFVAACDETISSAIQQLPEDTPEPTKTVFGVSPSWVSDGQIVKEYLEPIREISTKLSLVPTGFVVFPEAIANYLKSKSQGAMNAIVIGLTNEAIDVSVFRLGNLSGTVTVSRTVSLVDDVVQGLTKFGFKDPLPRSFILYDSTTAIINEAKEVLSTVDWGTQKPLTFLHTPTFSIVDPIEKIVAISLAGATEIEHVTEVLYDRDPDPDMDEEEEAVPLHSDSLDSDEEEPALPSATLQSAKHILPQMEEEEGDDLDDISEDHANVAAPRLKPTRTLPSSVSLPRMPKVSLPSVHFPKVSLPNFSSGGFTTRGQKKPIAIVVFTFLLLVGFFALWWFLPKGDITLYVSPQRLESRGKLSISQTASSVDTTAGVAPGKVVKVSVSGTDQIQTTGTKLTGDKAKGTITIRNGTSVIIHLASGSTVTSSTNLRFVLDSSASVSAALSPSSPGTATVSVTADAIGTDSNLAKGETFKVANYPKSEVDAVSESDFTGGTSRQITVVSRDDLKNLETAVTEKLKQSGSEKISETLTAEDYLVPNSLSTSLSKKSFSGTQGQEANTLSLDLSLDVSGVVASKADIISIARTGLEHQVPRGYVLRDSQIQFVIPEQGKVNGTATEFDVSYIANLLPNIDPDAITKKIAGKYPAVVQSYLSQSLPGFRRAEIVLKPRLPGFLGTLPHVANRIDITVSSEE